MTTVSIINPEVTYKESKTIDEEDLGYKSQVYELDLEDGLTISVVIGKPKYIYTDKNIISRKRIKICINLYFERCKNITLAENIYFILKYIQLSKHT
jgi:hypothetical protein